MSRHSIVLALPEWIGDELPKIIVSDTDQMEFVIRLAEQNVEEGTGGPFGAAIFAPDGTLIAVGVNCVVSTSCSIAHAEAIALMMAQQALGTYDLSSTRFAMPLRLVSSAQPCVQCFGIIWWSGIGEVVSGALAEDVEELTGFSEGPLPDHWIERLANRGDLPPIRVVRGFLAERSKRALIAYRRRGGIVYTPRGGLRRQ